MSISEPAENSFRASIVCRTARKLERSLEVVDLTLLKIFLKQTVKEYLFARSHHIHLCRNSLEMKPLLNTTKRQKITAELNHRRENIFFRDQSTTCRRRQAKVERFPASFSPFIG